MTTLTRRNFGIAAGTALGAATLGLRGAHAQAGGQIVVGTWGGDYQNLQQANVVETIVKPLGVEVVFDTANDTVRKTKLMAEKRLPRGTLDVVALTASGTYEMFKNDALLELDESRLPNVKYVLPHLKTKYSVPHIYTGRVILYNPKMIKTPPASYADLWKPENAGNVGVIDIQYQTTIESAAMINGGTLKNYEPGKEKLLELKKMGVKIYPTNEAMAQALKTEEVGMCIMWRARGVQWQTAGIPVEIVYPKEGVVLYVSEMAIPKNAKNKDGAYAYLNSLLDPRAQTAFAKSFGYTPTVSNVTLDPDLVPKVGFTPEQIKGSMVQDQDYLSQNDPQLQEWWNKVFKA